MDQFDNNQQSSSYTEFFSWGSDSHGQLALANTDEDQASYGKQYQFYDQPKSLSFDILISSISCGDYHAIFISRDGFVFSVGKNAEGQLGIGDPYLTQSSAPLLIDSLPKIPPSMISCGGACSSIVFQNGELYTWGQAMFGTLGLGTQNNQYAPARVQLKESTTFVYIDQGKRHSMAIDKNGQVYVSGDNQFRQLGMQHTERLYEFVKLSEFGGRAKEVACGLDHSLVLTDDDQVYACGNNSEGNLGLGHQYSSDNFLQIHGLSGLQISHIAAGRHSATITSDGRLFVWGPVFKGDKPLLLPQELRSNKSMLKVTIGEKVSSVIDEDHHIYTWGSFTNLSTQYSQVTEDGQNQMPQIVESLAGKIVTQVSIGLDFAAALGQDFDENGNVIDCSNNITQNESQHASILQQQEPPQFYSENKSISQYSQQYSTQKQQQQYTPGTGYREQNPSLYEQQHTGGVTQSQTIQNAYIKPPTPIAENQQKSNYQKYQNYDVIQNKSSIRDYPLPIPSANVSQISSNSASKMPKTASDNNIIERLPSRQGLAKQDQSFQSSNIPKRESQLPNVPLNISPIPTGVYNTQVSGISGIPLDYHRQLDVLREENFSLKQKQREATLQINNLKDENEQLVKNAESEIKRMSDFIDQFTLEIENGKRQMENEYEESLAQEKKKVEDMKNKMIKDQNEIEVKLDRLQREIEGLRQENLQLRQEKQDMSQQVQQIQQRVTLGETTTSFYREKERNMSPMVSNNNLQTSNYDAGYKQYSKTPLNISNNTQLSQQQQVPNSRQLNNQKQFGSKDSKSKITQQSDSTSQFQRPFSQEPTFQQQPSYSKLASQREVQFQGKSQTREEQQLQQQHIYSPNTHLGSSPHQYTTHMRHEGKQKHKDSPQRIADLLGIQSPIRQELAHEALRQSDFIKGGYEIEPEGKTRPYNGSGGIEDYLKSSEENQFKNKSNYYGQQQYKQPQYDYENAELRSKSKSPMKNVMQEAYQVHSRLQQQLKGSEGYSPSNVESFKRGEKENLGRGGPISSSQEGNGGGSGSLNDVKSRLVAMQRNKEELEEKLKAYETKIKQHFNK